MANAFANLGRSPDSSGEHFQLLEKCGQGGFAETWRARVLDPGRIEDYGTTEVALKIPLNKDKERQLEKEVQLNAVVDSRLRGIRSPNIVRYHGVSTCQGRLVMVMEFVAGGSLRDLLKKTPSRRLSVDDAVRITKGILGGLALIHAEHVFHRDLKPDNILMGEDNPKLADLGLSRFLDTSSDVPTASGTLYYMSPELLRGKGASLNSDIWSVGITLYESLTGKVPFYSNAIDPTIKLIQEGSFTPACEVLKDVSQTLSSVIDRALMKDPGERFQTAEEMLRALGRPSRSPKDKVVAELAVIRQSLGRIESSDSVEKSLLELLNKYPNDPRVFHCLGDCYSRSERHDEAIGAFEQGLVCDSQEALSHFHLGLAYQRAKQTEKAITSLKRALEIGLDARLKTVAGIALKTLEGNR